MTTTIKITELTDIGANLAGTTLVPVVNMAGTPTTQRANVNNIANYVLNKGTGANLGAVANVTITGGTAGQKLTTDGAGGLSWTNDANSSYGNSNVATFLASYGSNTISTTGNITAGNLVGNVSAGNITVGNITVNTRANLGAVGNVKITGGTDGYVLQTDGTGNLSWTAQTGGSGNATPAGANTQIQFNDAGSFGGNSGFTFNKTTGILTSPFLAGNGNGLSNIQGANVSGAVSYATTANSVAGANVSGAVSFATTANAVAAANVSGLGNIATVNLDGNSSNILYGNGVFDSIPNPFNQDLNTTDNVTFANITSTDAIRFSNSSNIVGALGYAPTYVSIEGYGGNAVNITANDVHTWSFGNTGSLTTPGPIYLPGGIGIEDDAGSIYVAAPGDAILSAGVTDGNGSVFLRTNQETKEWEFGADGNLTVPGNIISTVSTGLTLGSNYDVYIVADRTDNNRTWQFDGSAGELILPNNGVIDPSDDNFEVRGIENVNFEANAAVNIYTDSGNNGFQWQFGDDGNLTLPGNTFAVNYANGTPVSIGGGGNVSELVNGNNSFVLDSAGNVVFEGTPSGNAVDRGLVWDYGANANGVNSMIRQDLNGLTVRAWTELGGGANGYSAPVNIITNQDANTNTWRFDGQGNLTLPGNLNIPTGNIVSNIVAPAFNLGITGILSTGNANVTITVAGEVFEGNVSGQVTISNVNAPAQANGDWWYQASDFDQFQLFTDSSLTTPVDGSSWPGYAGPGGDAVGIGTYSNLTVQGGNVSINSNDKTWTFGTNGNLTVPGPITSTGDIQITAVDDVLIYGGDKTSGSEGGDIFIDGGAGANDNGSTVYGGGDVELQGGAGGDGLSSGAGAGGFVGLTGGIGGAANVANTVQAGEGGRVTIQGGSAGDNNGDNTLSGIGGNVEIYGGAGSFDAGNSVPNGAPGHVNLYGGNWGFVTPSGNIYLNTYDGTNFKTLTYDNHGNVTMAPGGALNFVGSNPGIVSGLNQDFYIRASDDETDGWSIYNVVDDGAGNTLSQTRLEYNQYTVRTNAQGNSYTWAFRESGVLDLPGDIYGNAGGNLFVNIVDQSGSNTFIDLRTTSHVGDTLISNIHIANPNVTISTSNAAYSWTFDGNGTLTVPFEGVIQSINDTIVLQSVDANSNTYSARLGTNGGLYFATTTYPQGWLNIENNSGNANITAAGGTAGGAGKNLYLTAGAADQTDFYTTSGGNINLTGGLGASNDGGGGGPGGSINLTAGNSADTAGVAGNVTINTGTNTWNFANTGNLTLPTISLGSGIDEQAVVSSQRKLIPPFRYSAVIDANNPTVVYNATDVNTTSMKVTMQIQHSGLGMEFFEVFATFTGADTYYTIGNRVSPPTIDASTVVVGLGAGSTMKITVTINSGATTSWVTYDAVEFGIAVD